MVEADQEAGSVLCRLVLRHAERVGDVVRHLARAEEALLPPIMPGRAAGGFLALVFVMAKMPVSPLLRSAGNGMLPIGLSGMA